LKRGGVKDTRITKYFKIQKTGAHNISKPSGQKTGQSNISKPSGQVTPPGFKRYADMTPTMTKEQIEGNEKYINDISENFEEYLKENEPLIRQQRNLYQNK
jgi:hypothetical protein